jgi:hypothetical protein
MMSLNKQAEMEALIKETRKFLVNSKTELLKEARRRSVAEVLLTMGWNHVLLLVACASSAYVVCQRIISSFVQVFVSN